MWFSLYQAAIFMLTSLSLSLFIIVGGVVPCGTSGALLGHMLVVFSLSASESCPGYNQKGHEGLPETSPKELEMAGNPSHFAVYTWE